MRPLPAGLSSATPVLPSKWSSLKLAELRIDPADSAQDNKHDPAVKKHPRMQVDKVLLPRRKASAPCVAIGVEQHLGRWNLCTKKQYRLIESSLVISIQVALSKSDESVGHIQSVLCRLCPVLFVSLFVTVCRPSPARQFLQSFMSHIHVMTNETFEQSAISRAPASLLFQPA